RRVMSLVSEMAERAADFSNALQELLAMLHRIWILQIVTEYEPDEAYDPQRLRGIAEAISPEDAQLYYQIVLLGQKELDLAPDPRSGFEMVLLRLLAFRPDQPEAVHSESGGSQAKSRRIPSGQPTGRKSADVKTAVQPAYNPSATDPSDWEAFVNAMNLGGITSQLAHNCTFHSWDGETLRLTLDASMKQLRVGQSEKRLLDSINRILGRETKLLITEAVPDNETPAMRQKRKRQERQKEAEATMMNDPLVREMEERFSARLLTDSIKPMDEPGS
ncbi:MAG: DNA polymerase III subunit gamma/tau C-terminal domain-containing protein, partial [Candidatus Thiodiazotropha sp.]